eukprot:2283309-Prymnesium_polylepis.2
MGRQPPGTKYPYLLRNSLALPLTVFVTLIFDDVSQLDPEVTGSLDPADRRSSIPARISFRHRTVTFKHHYSMIPPLFDALGAKYNLPDEITLVIIQYVKTHMAKAFVNDFIESDVCRAFVEHQRELFLRQLDRLSFYNQLLANAHLH